MCRGDRGDPNDINFALGWKGKRWEVLLIVGDDEKRGREAMSALPAFADHGPEPKRSVDYGSACPNGLDRTQTQGT